MSTAQDKVMDLVRDMLEENPDVELRAMYEAAREVNPDIGNLTLRQFSARYPLQIRRKKVAAPAKANKKTEEKVTKEAPVETATEDQDAVMEMVREELKQNPDIPTADLFEKAKEIDPKMGKLTARQFNARYPLQVKRLASLGQGNGRPRKRRRQTVDTSHIREILLDFAREIAIAQDAAGIIEVIGNVDQYVEKVVTASKR